jgi:hypothetical protein
MRFLKLSILASVSFFGVVCAQETPKPEKTAAYPVTITPDFPDGGINGFRELVVSKIKYNRIDPFQHLPAEQARELRHLILERRPVPKTILKSSLEFIVEIDGTLSGISAKGENSSFNKEIERVVKSIKTRWIFEEGEKKKTPMRMPIKMTIED